VDIAGRRADLNAAHAAALVLAAPRASDESAIAEKAHGLPRPEHILLSSSGARVAHGGGRPSGGSSWQR
jgi:hypothetical protein